ncbi:MAG TPA: sulfite oxidase [Thermoleophilaceae bacterium]|jgi:DMSO/TMAO reductase YedYZ molybdopterin-dependent catalytic subunit
MSSKASQSPAVDNAEGITPAELRLAARNHGLPLEALQYDLTPAGLHYLLIHYDIPVVDAAAWRLTVGGLVENELSLSLDDLRARPAVSVPVTMECAGNGRARLSPRPISQPWLLEAVGTAEWTGVPLRDLLVEAGVSDSAESIVFTGLDRGVEGDEEQQYERALTPDEAGAGDVLLAYSMNGQPLPPQHGFPLRLVVPGWYGMTNVKWLERITVLDRPFEGYQQESGYRFRQTADEPGEPVTRMVPRSLMTPPGIPNFADRERLIEPGPTTIRGRAWSGHGAIERVEVSGDGGATWADATLGPQVGPHAWRSWEFGWTASEGVHELCCRATDAAGNTQPLDAPWNLGGYANNEVQRVGVTVLATSD